MSGPGWFTDPTGRFGQRWYDGAAWTDNVVGANGSVVTDAMPETETPLAPPQPAPQFQPAPPPPSAPWGGAPPAPAGAYGGQHAGPVGPPGQSGAGPTDIRYAPGIGFTVGLLGAALVILSLFAFKWADTDKGTFLDLSSTARKAGGDGVNAALYAYVAWAGFVLVALTLIFVVLAGLPVPRSAAGNSYPRVIGAVIAGGGAVLQTYAIVQVFKGPADPQFGAWLGVVGYLVAVVGMVLGARRITR